MTIPKLQLCGAVLLSKLYSTIRQSLDVEIHNTVFWCDNTAVLNWINTPPYQLLTFIANRVAVIQEKTNVADWRIVRSLDNPADLISRGQLQSAYVSDKQWKNGPSWLADNEFTWPKLGVATVEELPGLRKLKCFTTPVHSDILIRYSLIAKSRRFIAYALRFKVTNKQRGRIALEELEAARTTIVRLVQAAHFLHKIEALREEGSVSPKSRLKSLTPFLDNQGIIRVGARLDVRRLRTFKTSTRTPES